VERGNTFESSLELAMLKLLEAEAEEDVADFLNGVVFHAFFILLLLIAADYPLLPTRQE